MRTLVKLRGAKCIWTERNDFLKVDPKADIYQDVEYMLVDPSCSGSGLLMTKLAKTF